MANLEELLRPNEKEVPEDTDKHHKVMQTFTQPKHGRTRVSNKSRMVKWGQVKTCEWKVLECVRTNQETECKHHMESGIP